MNIDVEFARRTGFHLFCTTRVETQWIHLSADTIEAMTLRSHFFLGDVVQRTLPDLNAFGGRRNHGDHLQRALPKVWAKLTDGAEIPPELLHDDGAPTRFRMGLTFAPDFAEAFQQFKREQLYARGRASEGDTP